MDNIIAYYLIDKENKITKVRSLNTSITIIKGNIDFLTAPTCGKRYTSIYMDKELMNPIYDE